MHGLIVVTGLDRLSPSERWPRLVAPLAAELEESGLGEVVECADLEREFQEHGRLNVAEVGVRLRNLDYGNELVDRMITAAGLDGRDSRRPARWEPFRCDDYYSSEFCLNGYWDEAGQFWYLVSFDEVFENEDYAFLDVGGAGVDGIRFGYRRGYGGFWAFPIDGEFVLLAETVGVFLTEWLAGRIRL